MNVVSPITFWGTFASPEMEEKFRRESLVEDLRIARFLILLVALGALIFLLNDWRVLGGATIFLTLIGARVVILLFAAGLLLRFLHAITPQVLDWWLLAWSAVVLFVTLYIYSTRTPYRMNHALSALLIVGVSILVPMRFSFQAGTATLFALGTVGLLIDKNPDRFMLLENLIALTLAVFIGVTASGKLHRIRRESFAGRQVERETIGELVRTLQGVLPICAWCKKIRQEDGNWTILEKYISEHSEARFSHGLCPECKAKLYQEHPSLPKDQ